MKCQIKGCGRDVGDVPRDDAVCAECEARAVEQAREALFSDEKLAELKELADVLNAVIPPERCSDQTDSLQPAAWRGRRLA